MLNTDHFQIQQLVEVCIAKGIQHAVICPGSRNAPLTIAFNRSSIECITIPDERVAAFFALGISLQTKSATAIICTSGSAVLNFSPAIVEAFYQGIPMLVLTADRPPEIIDQGHGQTIRQSNIYSNYIKASMDLPQNTKLAEVTKCVVDAIDISASDKPGPVHINIPLEEPLYGLTKKQVPNVELDEYIEESIFELSEFKNRIETYQKVLLIVGQMNDAQLTTNLKKCLANKNIVVLSEVTSNIEGQTIESIDSVLSALDKNSAADFAPDLLISMGAAVVSKKVKAYLNKYKPKEHWNVGPIVGMTDTYDALTHYLECDESEFAKMLGNIKLEGNYWSIWFNKYHSLMNKTKHYLNNIEWSDFSVFNQLLQNIPAKSDVHFGNSTVVRYGNLFELNHKFNNYCNRGTSGIDGVTSTAMGSAYASKNTTTVITGDIAFLYDSNAFWHNYLAMLDLKIILINNGGGGIFRIIPGPDQLEELEQYFDCYSPVDIQKLVEAYGITYHSAECEESLQSQLNKLYERKGIQFLEIKTDGAKSAKILRDYFKALL